MRKSALTAAEATTIPLTPLAATAVAEMAKDVLGAPAGGDLLRTLGGAQGNPFLIVDLLAGLREENLVRVTAGRAWPGTGFRTGSRTACGDAYRVPLPQASA